MVGETMDMDNIVKANIEELKTRADSKKGPAISNGLEYCKEHAYLNIKTGRFTYSPPSIEKDKYFRISFKILADGQVLQVYDTSGGMHEGDINWCLKETPLDKSDVFPEEIKQKVTYAIQIYNLERKKKASDRKTARLKAQINTNPKAPSKEKKSITQRLLRRIIGE